MSCYRRYVLILFCFVAAAGSLPAQPQKDKQAFVLLDNAFGKALKSQNIAFDFEGVAFNLPRPLDIFSLPVYKIYRGGYLYMDKDKMQLQLGIVKTVSDGSLVVVVDEISKTMYVDSVRTPKKLDGKEKNELKKAFGAYEYSSLSYEGEDTLNDHTCYKVKAVMNDKNGRHVLYWIDKSTGQLYLMAEKQVNGYDVYWFRSTGPAPAGHKYAVHLPAKELESFHGYNVIDNRFLHAKK